MKKQLTKILTVVMSLIMVLSLAACGNNEPIEEEEVTLRFYNYSLSEKAKAGWWEKTIANFEADNPKIKIEVISCDFNSMVTTLTNDLASGLGVDLIFGETNWVCSLGDGGFIQEPKNVLDADFYADYYDFALSAHEYKGQTLAVPIYYGNRIIFLNKTLIEGAGLSMDNYPKTLDELKAWIVALHDTYMVESSPKYDSDIKTLFGVATNEVQASGNVIYGLLNAFGGTLITDDGKLNDLENGQSATAMNEMLDFLDWIFSNGYAVNNQKLKDYRAAFGAGKVAMYIDSPWGYAQIGEVDKNASSFTVAGGFPYEMGTYGKGDTLPGTHCFMVGADVSDAKASAINKFIQYCTKGEVLQDYLTEIGLAYPAHKSTETATLSPIIAGAADCTSRVQNITYIPATSQVEKLLATLAINHTANGMTAKEAIDKYVKDANYYING